MTTIISKIKYLATCSMFVIGTYAFGAVDEVLNVLNGPDINNTVSCLETQDQWYTYMQGDPLNWPEEFKINETRTDVFLRFTDQLKTYYPTNWTVTVNYEITTQIWNDVLHQFEPMVYTSESLQVTYDPSAIYQDVAVYSYPMGMHSCFTITSVSSTLGAVPEDVILEIVQHTDRTFKLYTNSPPPVSRGTVANSYLPLNWDYIQGAEAYELEWLFIDDPNSLSNPGLKFDFKNAIRIKTTDQFYRIPLAYPKGAVLYRVRAVGLDIANNKHIEKGIWSFAVNSGTLNSDAPSNPPSSYSYRYDFNGMETGKNWNYSSEFSDNGNHSDMITFSDGLVRTRQTVAFSQQQEKAIVGEQIVDFFGRTVVDVLPAAVNYQGIKFYHGDVGQVRNFNYGFDWRDFDGDHYYWYDVEGDNMLSRPEDLTNGSGNFYSPLNPDISGYAGYTADAEGKPYVINRLKNDGTNRLIQRGGLGEDLTVNNGHDNKVFYGKPASQAELDRLFGNEVGSLAHYSKVTNIDANGQGYVNYYDMKSRVIATALMGPVPDNLLQLDDAEPVSNITGSLLENNFLNQDQQMENMSAITVTVPNTVYDFHYALEEDCYELECFQCEDCKYDMEIAIQNQDGDYVVVETLVIDGSSEIPTNPIVVADFAAVVVDFSIEFLVPGTYYINKLLYTNEDASQAAADALEDYILTDPAQDCVDLIEVILDDCPLGCIPECILSFPLSTVEVDAGNPGEETVYYNSGTGEYFETAAELAEYCTGQCEDVFAGMDECQMKYDMLLHDMSPGGQYFDNTIDQYDESGNDPDPSPNPGYQFPGNMANLGSINTWNLANLPLALITTFQNGYNTANGTSLTFGGWNSVREYWMDTWAEELVIYHPEYNIHEYFCNGFCYLRDTHLTPEIDLGTFDHAITAFDHPAENVTDIRKFKEWLYSEEVSQSPIDNSHGLNFFNPIGMPAGQDVPNPQLSDNQNYFPGTYAEVDGLLPELRDPIAYCSIGYGSNILGVPCDIYDPMDLDGYCLTNSFSGYAVEPAHFNPHMKLTRFLQFDTNEYYSIWYFLDDPAGIHLIPPGVQFGDPADYENVKTIFRQFHGDGGGLAGIFNTPAEEGGMSKFDFFRGYYSFFREMAIYLGLPDAYPGLALLTSPDDNGLTSDGYSIRYPVNTIFEAYDSDPLAWMAAMQSEVDGDAIEQIQTTYVDAWIVELGACIDPADQSIVSEILANLVYNTSDEDSPLGSSVCDFDDEGYDIDGFGGVDEFNSFEEVITHYEITAGGCPEIIHPEVFDVDGCAWEQFHQYLLARGIPFSASAAADIVVALNDDFGSPVDIPETYENELLSFNAFEVSSWFASHTSEIPMLLVDGTVDYSNWPHWPSNFFCVQLDNLDPVAQSSRLCTWTNFLNFCALNELDLPPTPVPVLSTEVINIANAIDAYLTTLGDPFDLVTPTDVAGWFNGYYQQPPVSIEDWEAFPEIWICDPHQTYRGCQLEVDLQEKELEWDAFEDAVHDFVEQYQQDYEVHCVNSMDGRETFTATYQLSEYYYTLYYYDQADNLIKTVPPKGVHPITDPLILAQVSANRDNGYDPELGNFVWPAHRMVSNYKHNTLESIIESTTPDGGTTRFYYDHLGRNALSQDAVQAELIPLEYSYILFDKVGLQVEVGLINSTEPLTQEISGYLNDTYLGEDEDADPDDMEDWYAAAQASRHDITQWFYDEEETASDVHAQFGSAGQEHVRGEISYSRHLDDLIVEPVEIEHNSIYYSYDDHGLVKTVVQQNAILNSSGGEFFRTEYKYSAISGNTNQIIYERGRKDQYILKYLYDDDGNNTHVFSSTDNMMWEQDSKYLYSATGAHARTEIGERQVQAVDYAYTLQMWTKAINSSTGEIARDIGRDSKVAGQHEHFGADAYALSMHFHDNDYKAINTANNTAAGSPVKLPTLGDMLDPTLGLYTGNVRGIISTMVTDGSLMSRETVGKSYRYDQLQRIRNVDVVHAATDDWEAGTVIDDDMWKEEFHYDFNGNIKSLNRNGNNLTYLQMDAFNYNYDDLAYDNRLLSVDDAAIAQELGLGIADDTYQGDIKAGQVADNYTYDATGNMTSDKMEEIESIKWNAMGQVKSIQRTLGSDKDDLEFIYNSDGDRIAKIVKPRPGGVPSNEIDWNYELYAYDAEGTLMSTYTASYSFNAGEYTETVKLNEQMIYGKARVGTLNRDITLQTRHFTSTGFNTGTPPEEFGRFLDKDYEIGTIYPPLTCMNLPCHVPNRRRTGTRNYELTDHLGNVTTAIGDRKFSYDDNTYNALGVFVSSTPDGKVDYYDAEVLSSTDYYAFGSSMPGRNYNPGEYLFAFNGMKNESEWSTGYGEMYDFGSRIMDPRIGRFFSMDNFAAGAPGITPYQVAWNNPIILIDELGDWPCVTCWIKENALEIVSTALDFIPVVGTIKGWVEAAVGYDMAGNKLSAAERIAAILPYGKIVSKAAKVAKVVVKAVEAVKVVKKAIEAGKKVVTKAKEVVQKTYAKAEDWVNRNFKSTKKGKTGERIEENKMREKYKDNPEVRVVTQLSVKSAKTGQQAYLDVAAVNTNTGEIVEAVESKVGKGAKMSDGQIAVEAEGAVLTPKSRAQGNKEIRDAMKANGTDGPGYNDVRMGENVLEEVRMSSTGAILRDGWQKLGQTKLGMATKDLLNSMKNGLRRLFRRRVIHMTF